MASSHKDKTHIMLCEYESVQIFTGVVTEMDGNMRIWDAVNINMSECCLSSPVPSDFLQVICFIVFPLHIYIFFNYVTTNDLLAWETWDFVCCVLTRCMCCYYGSRSDRYVILCRLWVHLTDSYLSPHLIQITTLYHIININGSFSLSG